MLQISHLISKFSFLSWPMSSNARDHQFPKISYKNSPRLIYFIQRQARLRLKFDQKFAFLTFCKFSFPQTAAAFSNVSACPLAMIRAELFPTARNFPRQGLRILGNEKDLSSGSRIHWMFFFFEIVLLKCYHLIWTRA